VTGVPAEPATETLARAGLNVEVVEVPDDQYPPGIVVATEPPAGAARPEAGVVVLRVANGERVPRAPDLLGTRADEVVEQLEATYDLQVRIEADPDAEAAAARPGVIWQAEPAAGAPLFAGETLTVWVNPG
jgi:beta-lactam-binding protein with PASTA domain